MSVPILTFHAIEEGSSVLGAPLALLRDALDRFEAAGWRAAPLPELARQLARGIPVERRFGVSFDDGYRSVYDRALPLLSERGVPATVFVCLAGDGSSHHERLPEMEGRERLSWRELRELCRHGFTVGAHTLTHPDLRRLDTTAIEREMDESKRRLEEETGAPVTTFAYPYGRYDARARAAAAARFDAAFSDRLAPARPGDDLFALPRVDAYYLRPELARRQIGHAGLESYLALRNLPRRLRRLATGG